MDSGQQRHNPVYVHGIIALQPVTVAPSPEPVDQIRDGEQAINGERAPVPLEYSIT
jgi:hypothetical protein